MSGSLSAQTSMSSYVAAIDAGAYYIELDVWTSSDWKSVIMRYSTLNRTTNWIGEVRQHTFDEIRALDVGAKFALTFAIPRFLRWIGHSN
jgi:glycerophosphoryl diester phosphodiesterase